MTYQPHDVFVSTYDDDEFNNFEEQLTLFSYSQADNNIFNRSHFNDLSSPATQSLALNNLNEIPDENFDSFETPSPELAFEFNEELFSEAQLNESSMDLFDGLIDEGTTTTTTSDAESANNNAPSELNLTPGATETTTENVPDRINLKSVPSSIQKKLLSVSVHPTNDPRRRYESEGTRRIKKLRSNPMILDLSKLQKYALDPNQLLWIRLSLITYSDNPLDNVYIHTDILKYYSGKVRVLIDGSICILVTQSDIDKGKIELKDLLIIKKKKNTYTFQLIPYNLSTIDDQSETYIIDKTETTMGNAKIFRKKFNLKASRIACQILIEENESYNFTHITCVTNPMIEQEYEPKTMKPNKSGGKSRNTKKSKSIKSGETRRNTKKSKSIKRKKRSNY